MTTLRHKCHYEIAVEVESQRVGAIDVRDKNSILWR